jgi:hypothetical protein
MGKRPHGSHASGMQRDPCAYTGQARSDTGPQYGHRQEEVPAVSDLGSGCSGKQGGGVVNLIERVLMIRENAGSGTEDEPYRWVRIFVREDTLEEICRVDDFEIEELRRKAAK